MIVYVIRAAGTDLYKIGTARNPRRRLAQLQTASPLHLELVCTADGAVERLIHRALHETRAKGEWFELSEPPTAADLIAWSGSPTSGNSPNAIPDDDEFDIVGTGEVAERLKVEHQTVRAWRTRGLMPDCEWSIGGRPVWQWVTVEQWARETGRLTTDS